MWCDPRNGSGKAFQQGLKDLGQKSGHPELSKVPWALWGHSGGGHWAGGMTLLYPDRVAAAWLRSGVPLLEQNPDRPTIKPHDLPEKALRVPIMCNPGTKEGVTLKTGRFARVWPANEKFILKIRAKAGCSGFAVDPLTAHECGNSRYMAIPWLDACLKARLPAKAGAPSSPCRRTKLGWLLCSERRPCRLRSFRETKESRVASECQDGQAMDAVRRGYQVVDKTPPPAPTHLKIKDNALTWKARADFESGLSHFIIERDGEKIGTVPEKPGNRFGRPLPRLAVQRYAGLSPRSNDLRGQRRRGRKESCLPGGGRQHGRIAVEIRKASPGRRTWPNSLWIFPRDTFLRSWQSCPSRFRIRPVRADRPA